MRERERERERAVAMDADIQTAYVYLEELCCPEEVWWAVHIVLVVEQQSLQQLTLQIT